MDERIWTDRPLQIGHSLEKRDCRISREAVPHVTLVSGDLGLISLTLASGAQKLGLADVPAGSDYMITISRDHAALVTDRPVERRSGWQPEGFALSPAPDAYALFTLRGPRAEAILGHGLNSVLPVGSLSCAVRFAHRTMLVTGLPDGFALWVLGAEITFVTRFLNGISDH
ncbi:hypothetical protein [Roseovarius aquimarinus]|uniref:Sarcosine oxidase subunit gamma n=1 Tax=Roseovarius aquimarinus TaxID=1229156 RepID=A0ABW7IAJ9_9RHOB